MLRRGTIVPPAMDFRALSRNSKKIRTSIVLWSDYAQSEWIQLGEIMFRENGDRNSRGTWLLGAYLSNATDFEHDAAWLFKMELIGVRFTSCEYGQTSFEGWIKPDNSEDFRVPSPDYNPLKHKDATKCGGTAKEYCKRGEPHVIVPEGFYIPPENPELFNIVRGRRIEVTTGLYCKEEP